MKPTDMWPFAKYMNCVLCDRPVETYGAAVIVEANQWAGFAHKACMEKSGPIEQLALQGELL